MARPMKCRRVCGLPVNNEFVPVKNDRNDPVILTVDEYEAIRLIDNEDFSQEKCSVYMQVARTTVQQIYDNARKKVARALVDGRAIRIEGGEYRICDGTGCMCSHCHRRMCSGGERSENSENCHSHR